MAFESLATIAAQPDYSWHSLMLPVAPGRGLQIMLVAAGLGFAVATLHRLNTRRR